MHALIAESINPVTRLESWWETTYSDVDCTSRHAAEMFQIFRIQDPLTR